MALTAEGRELTRAHQRQQIALAHRAVAASKPLWASVVRAQGVWLAAQLHLLHQFYGQSEALAATYVDAYRDAEGVRDPAIERAPFPVAETTAVMLTAGPRKVLDLLAGGDSADQALSKSFTKFSGMVSRQVLSGGRMLVDRTTERDRSAIGWRRVTDGNPCTFCAMLATRGPVYRSAETASQIAGSGLHYHGHCGCTAEIVYGDWIPNEQEQQYIDVYDAAARAATAEDKVRTQDTVLWRMRAAGSFRDSPSVRNKQ